MSFGLDFHFARWENTSFGNLPKHGSPQILGPPVLKRHVASILGFGQEIRPRGGDALKPMLVEDNQRVTYAYTVGADVIGLLSL
jgi:hypothetical protein